MESEDKTRSPGAEKFFGWNLVDRVHKFGFLNLAATLETLEICGPLIKALGVIPNLLLKYFSLSE